MAASTANWHWKSKGVSPWAKGWFETELPTVIFTENDVTIGVSDVSSFDGDVELGMRKSKLITIFDVSLTMNWTATHSNGANAKGSLTIPEVSHGVVVDDLEDYTYEWKLTKSTPAEDAPSTPTEQDLYAQVKKQLPAHLTKLFQTFPKAIVDTHGKDLVATPTASGAATPSNESSGSGSTVTPAAVAAATATPAPVKPGKKVSNSSTVRAEAQFMISAADLFSLLTDESRIPQWTRAPAQSSPTPGGTFSLFGGGVVGKFVSIDQPTSFVQSWRLRSPQWPDDHDGTLTTTLEQQSDSTKLVLELQGVPKGQEDEIERNLIGYYINSLKNVGLGSQL